MEGARSKFFMCGFLCWGPLRRVLGGRGGGGAGRHGRGLHTCANEPEPSHSSVSKLGSEEEPASAMPRRRAALDELAAVS
mgnify:CR=1 FL=1